MTTKCTSKTTRCVPDIKARTWSILVKSFAFMIVFILVSQNNLHFRVLDGVP